MPEYQPPTEHQIVERISHSGRAGTILVHQIRTKDVRTEYTGKLVWSDWRDVPVVREDELNHPNGDK